MTHKPHSLRYTGSALAAALAFVSTPVLAQDIAAAAPPVDVAPAITVPDIAPATPPPVATVAPAEPVAEPAPPPAARTQPVARPAPAPVRAAPAAPREIASPAPVTETVTPEIAQPLPPVAIEPAPVVAEAAPAAVEQPASTTDSGLIAAIVAGLAVLALFIGGLIAFSRRRTPAAAMEAQPAPEVLQSRRAAAIVPTLPATEPQPLAAQTLDRTPVPMTRPAAYSAPQPAVSHSGAAVALPRELPTSFEERDALIKRMVAAKPDRANPFTSPIQRRKRAKLILQSLGRDFGDAEPWIDLSQYPQNWPELARRRYAAAA